MFTVCMLIGSENIEAQILCNNITGYLFLISKTDKIYYPKVLPLPLCCFDMDSFDSYQWCYHTIYEKWLCDHKGWTEFLDLAESYSLADLIHTNLHLWLLPNLALQRRPRIESEISGKINNKQKISNIFSWKFWITSN